MIWILSVGVAGVGIVLLGIWIGARLRRTEHAADDVSPEWLNENVYGRGKQGDDEWK